MGIDESALFDALREIGGPPESGLGLSIRDLAKELGDLEVVTVGTLDVLGIDGDEVFDAVHRSNMSKLGPDGKPIRREDGKILKPDTYKPADLSWIPE